MGRGGRIAPGVGQNGRRRSRRLKGVGHGPPGKRGREGIGREALEGSGRREGGCRRGPGSERTQAAGKWAGDGKAGGGGAGKVWRRGTERCRRGAGPRPHPSEILRGVPTTLHASPRKWFLARFTRICAVKRAGMNRRNHACSPGRIICGQVDTERENGACLQGSRRRASGRHGRPCNRQPHLPANSRAETRPTTGPGARPAARTLRPPPSRAGPGQSVAGPGPSPRPEPSGPRKRPSRIAGRRRRAGGRSTRPPARHGRTCEAGPGGGAGRAPPRLSGRTVSSRTAIPCCPSAPGSCPRAS